MKLNFSTVLFVFFSLVFIGIIIMYDNRINSKKYSIHNSVKKESNIWEYPIKFGDSKKHVRKMLGLPTTQKFEILSVDYDQKPIMTSFEHFSHSGLAIRFDEFDQVCEFIFFRIAGEELSLHDWQISKNNIAYNINLSMDRNNIVQILGEPNHINIEDKTTKLNIWKKDFLLMKFYFNNQDSIKFLYIHRVVF